MGPQVHGFYRVENPDLAPHVRLTFPAHSCEFSGDETLEEAVSRYRTLKMNNFDREPLPFLKMRYTNTRTRGRSGNPGRGLTEPKRLLEELRLMEGGEGSFVEFENRHGKVWRVEWHGAWFIQGYEHAHSPGEGRRTCGQVRRERGVGSDHDAPRFADERVRRTRALPRSAAHDGAAERDSAAGRRGARRCSQAPSKRFRRPRASRKPVL
ncbi:hypothetical protein ACFYW8_04320 [Streptomyces sp. NPDC002742]|uniref:hypothetical protein n=1 Tax=Streptomyces sp. NPDC002742 TaxID=3364663 RepID=UPI0036D05D56